VGLGTGDPTVERLKRYADQGVERCVVCPPSHARHPASETPRRLDDFYELTFSD